MLPTQEGPRYRSPTYRALGYTFAFHVDDPDLAAYLAELYRPFRVAGPARSVYTFRAIEDAGAQNYLLHHNDLMIDNHRRPSVPFETLLWHINRSVVRHSQDRLLIHASAVARGDVALLFPAAMESGKTTLAAGLVREGFDYITDETVAIDPTSGDVEPFPRALSVDPGSWGVLADLRPRVSSRVAPYLDRQWQLPPTSIRPDCVAGITRPGFVITPRYVAGGRTELVPMRRADGVAVLAEHAFNFGRYGGEGLRLLANLVRGAVCFRLQIGDLGEACRIITELLDADVHGPSGGRDGSTLESEARV